MIDNGKYTTHYNSPEEIERVLSHSQISFDRIATNKHTGEEIHLHNFRNLTLGVNYRLCKVSVTGSLTTFCKGNNYTNISFSETVKIIETICDTLKKDPDEILIHRIEYSLIIKTPLQPCTYIENLLSYKKKRFYNQIPPAWSAKPLLSFCSLQQFVIKFYDTAKWHKLPNVNFLKYEIKFTRAEKVLSILKKKSPLTFAHLLAEESFLALGNFALDVYKMIDTAVTISPGEYRALSNKRRRLLFAGEHPTFWKMESVINRNTYRKDRKEYLALKDQFKGLHSDPMKDLERKITDTARTLLKN